MSSNSFGQLFTVTTFGESHGPAIGCVIDGCPPGIAIAAEEFRRDLVNMPLCGKPTTGPVAGKTMCTVHASDGTATLAGPGLVARMVWDTDGSAVCRRDVKEAPSQRRCVTY